MIFQALAQNMRLKIVLWKTNHNRVRFLYTTKSSKVHFRKEGEICVSITGLIGTHP